jgi:protein tyrosine/serine phosphatase
MLRFLIPCICWLAITVSFADVAPDSIPIDKFKEVTVNIYRGARPSLEGIQALSENKFKTDLDLENDDDAIELEKQHARTYGLEFISEPMSGFFSPSDEQVNRILSIVNDPRNYPIFIHCKHGEDRTGLIVGLYRVFTQNWPASAAYDEMLDDGFHPILLGLQTYFDERTSGLSFSR